MTLASPSEQERKAALRRERNRLRSARFRASPEGKAWWAANKHKYPSTKYAATHRAYARRPEVKDARWAKHIERKYGITAAQYQAMLDRQHGVCAICKNAPKTRRLSVDHDHQTKRVRGLLCHVCNKYRVGMNRRDHVDRVARYIKSTFDGRNL